MTASERTPTPMNNENAGIELTIEVGANCLSVKIFNRAKNIYISNGPVLLNDLSTVNTAISQIFGLLLQQKKELTKEPTKEPKTSKKGK